MQAQGSVKALVQHQSIGERREIIVKGDMIELGLHALPLLKYAQRQHDSEHQKPRCYGKHDALEQAIRRAGRFAQGVDELIFDGREIVVDNEDIGQNRLDLLGVR